MSTLINRYLLTVTIAVCLLSGCSSYEIGPYRHSYYGSEVLGKLEVSDIAVGEFISATVIGNSEICGSGKLWDTIRPPKGETFNSYFRNALISELDAADVYAWHGAVVLTGEISRIDLKTTYRGILIVGSEWEISVTLNSSNGRSLSVTNTTHASGGRSRCKNSAASFATAVKNTVFKLIKHQDFKQLVI